MQNIGDNIKFYRKLNKMSQEELGKHLGVRKQTIEKYENNKIFNIPFEKIEKIALALGITPNELLGLDPIVEANTDIAKLIRKIEKLSPEQIKSISIIIDSLSDK